MTPLLIAMQLAPGGVAPPVAPVPPPTPIVQPPPVPPPPVPAAAPAPPSTWPPQPPAPMFQPRGAVQGGWVAPPSLPARSAPPPVAPDPKWFARLGLGFGTVGFSGNNTLLSEAGYGGFKLWTTLDGAYMVTPRVGAGLWMGLNRRAVQPDLGARLNEVAYFVAAQAPVKIWGSSLFAVHATPRLGFLSGKLELGRDGNATFDNTAIFGVGVSGLSFAYHVGASLSFMHARTPDPPGELGSSHDYGGLYFSIGGTIDG